MHLKRNRACKFGLSNPAAGLTATPGG